MAEMSGESRVALVIVLALFLTFVATVLIADTSAPDLHSTWPESAEFSQLVSGQERFSEHATNVDGLLVVVDHATGAQYLVTATGACPLLDLACRALYGEDSGKGGLDALMGSAVADCISFRYVDARPWKEVATLMGYSHASWHALRDMCQRGFDAIDSLGWEQAIEGVGDAT